jgi:two-component system cell cycle sensor histidine kinase/response regulator CckA
MLTRRNGKRLKEGKTERLLDEGSLPGNGALFKTIFEKAALGIVVTDPDGRILQSNPFFQELLGYSSKEIIGRDSHQFTHPDDVANERSLFLRAMGDGQDTVQLKKRYVHKDGHAIWVDLRATICRGAAGEPDFVISAVEDITDKLGINEALRENEEPYRMLAEAAHDMIFILNREEKVDYVNSFAIQQLALLPEEILGRSIAELFPGDAEHQYRSIRQVFEAGQPLYVESPVQFPNRKIWLGTWLVPIKDEAGQVKSILGVSRDITDRKRAEAQLERNLRETRLRLQVGQALAGAETEDKVLDVLIQQAGFYPQAFVSIFTFDRRGGETTAIVRRQGIFESGLKAVVPIGGSLPASRYPLYHHFSADKPFVSEDVLADERVEATEREIFRQTGAASLTVIPLTAENEWMGFLGVTAKDTGYFDEEKQRLYQTLAEQGAVALRAARLREAIGESQQRFQALVETMNDWIWEVDQNGLFSYVSPRISDLLGYEPEELLGKTPFDFMSPEETARVRGVFDQLSGNRQPVINVENTLLHKDGRLVVFETSATPFFDPGGEFKGYRGVDRDITERKRIEERYRTIVRTALDGFWLLDMQGRFLDVNDAYCNLIGYSREELLTMGIPDIEAVEKPGETAARIRNIMKVGGDRFETHHKCKDGRVVDVEVSVNYMRDEERMFVFLRDITERKRVEEALRYERNLLRTLIDNLPDGIYVKDKACRKMIANPADVRNMGRQSEAEVLGKDDFDLFPKDLAEGFFADDQSVLQTGQPVLSREEYVLDADGQKRWLSTSKLPLKDEQGRIIGLVGIGRDITKHKRAEEALQQERNLLRTVIDNLPDVIYVKDANCRKTVVNKADLRNMGCQSEAEALGKTDFDLYPREVAEAFYADDQSVIHTGQPVINREEYFLDAEGRKHWLLTTKVPLKDQQGQIIGLVGIGRDITNRVQATEGLRESQQMLQTVLDTIPVRVFWRDRESRYLGCNSPFARDAGFNKPEDLVGKNDFQLSWRDQASLYRADDLQVITTGLPKLNYEEQQTVADGHCAWVLTSKIPLLNAKGEITGVLGTYEDITERKRTEEALHHERNLLRTLIDNLPDAIYVKDADCRKTVVNQADLRNMGCQSEADALGKTDFSLYPTEVAKAFYADDLSVLETGQAVVNREEFFFDPEGRKRWLLTSKLPLRDQKGHIIGLVGIGHDITERRRTEEALTKLSSAVEQAVDGVIITTKAGIIEYVNPAWEKMTAFSKEDTVGKTPRILKSGKQGDSFYRAMWKTISDGEVWKGSLINKKKSGELFHAEVSIAPIFDESHNITHFVAIERDVTEHRQLEQQLIQALRMEGLGTLAGGVAHDFNNLLGIILGHASLLDGRRQDPTKFSRSVNAISTAVQRGTGLVRQLLTFARKTEAVLELVSANETVEELVQMLRETFPRTIEFSLDLSPDLPSIPADRNQLYQALLNLCINSRDAMPTVGTISIRTDTIPRSKLQAKHANAIEEKYIRIMVSDTGKGMDEATRSRIFEPFFTTKERGKGTGLGLSVVYGVVDSHNGFIDVESEVGHGTTFNMYFPILPLRVEPSLTQQQEPSEIVGAGETVLVIEDEELLMDSVTQVLEGKGYRVLAARDGAEGLEIYSRHQDDVAVVLMDMGLPKLDGWEVFQKMKAVNPRVKVVLASGYLDPYIKSEMLKAGAKDFIQKPYVPEQILSRVHRVIDGK